MSVNFGCEQGIVSRQKKTLPPYVIQRNPKRPIPPFVIQENPPKIDGLFTLNPKIKVTPQDFKSFMKVLTAIATGKPAKDGTKPLDMVNFLLEPKYCAKMNASEAFNAMA